MMACRAVLCCSSHSYCPSLLCSSLPFFVWCFVSQDLLSGCNTFLTLSLFFMVFLSVPWHSSCSISVSYSLPVPLALLSLFLFIHHLFFPPLTFKRYVIPPFSHPHIPSLIFSFSLPVSSTLCPSVGSLCWAKRPEEPACQGSYVLGGGEWGHKTSAPTRLTPPEAPLCSQRDRGSHQRSNAPGRRQMWL